MAGSELVALFGDELAEVRRARIGIRVVGGTKVHAGDIAAMLLALGVVDLVDAGLATLDGAEVKGRFGTSETLMVRSEPGGEGLSGLVAEKAEAGLDVGSLAARVLGSQEVVGVEMKLIGIAQGFLAGCGAVRAASKKGVLARMGASTDYVVDDHGAERLRGEWDRIHQVWQAFKAADASKADMLVSRCAASVTACKAATMDD